MEINRKIVLIFILFGIGFSLSCPVPIRESVPEISGISIYVSGIGATIKWKTDVAANSQVEYGNTDSYGNSSDKDNNLNTDHIVYLTGLNKKQNYHYKVKSVNEKGSESSSIDQVFATPDDASHFPFDTINDNLGWHCSTAINELGIVSATQSVLDKKNGSGSIRLDCDIQSDVSGNGTKSKGLVYVDLPTNAPPGIANGTIDFTGKSISIWVNLPAEFIGGGISIYVMDTNDSYVEVNTDYSIAGWQQITADPVAWTAGIDLKKVKRVGLNVHRGYTNADIFSFSGSIYLDSVVW